MIPLDDDALKTILSGLRADPEGPWRAGWAVAEGETCAAMLLRSSHAVGGVLGVDAADTRCTTVVDRPTLGAILGFRLRSPIIAVTPAVSADVHDIRTPCLVLDGIVDAANVGALVRTAMTLGLRSVVCSANSASPWLRRAVRTSMGTCFHIPCAVVDDVAAWLADQRAEGCRIIGLETAADAVPILGAEPADIIVVGSEGHGLSPSVRRVCDQLVEIPMAMAGVSLNVVQAAAIGCWELLARPAAAASDHPVS